MSFFKKLFGNTVEKGAQLVRAPSAPEDPSADPDMIRVFDKCGREMFIMPEFKDKVEALQNEFPIPGPIGDLASTAIAEVFAV